MPRKYRRKQLPDLLPENLDEALKAIKEAPKLKLVCPQRGKKRGQKPTALTPEARARMAAGSRKAAEARKAKNGTGTNKGIPYGHSKDTIDTARNLVYVAAKEIVQEMTEKLGIDDEYAKEALTYCVGVIRGGENIEATGTRLQAAKIVLDFTKTKPATKSDVTISKAEDFLKQIAED